MIDQAGGPIAQSQTVYPDTWRPPEQLALLAYSGSMRKSTSPYPPLVGPKMNTKQKKPTKTSESGSRKKPEGSLPPRSAPAPSSPCPSSSIKPGADTAQTIKIQHGAGTSATPSLITNANPPNRPPIKSKDVSARKVGISEASGSGIKSTLDVSSGKLHMHRRNALRIIARCNAKAEKDLTEQNRASLKWANSILAQFPMSTGEGLTSKRQRSVDESPKDKDVKRARVSSKPSTLRPFSEVLKEQITLAVIDRSKDDGSISSDDWGKVEVFLASNFLRILREYPGSVPDCHDGGWYQGRVKLIICADQRSADLYKIAIGRAGEIWTGARLEVVAKEDIPNRPRSRVWIPIEPSDPAVILEIMQTSNPHLPTHNWKIAKLEEPKGNSRCALVVLNQESLAPLAQSKGVIKYGFAYATLKVYKKDEKGTEVEAVAETSPVEEVKVVANPDQPAHPSALVGRKESVKDGKGTSEDAVAESSTSKVEESVVASLGQPACSSGDLDRLECDMEVSDSEMVLSPLLGTEEDLLRSDSESEAGDTTVLEVSGGDNSKNATSSSD